MLRIWPVENTQDSKAAADLRLLVYSFAWVERKIRHHNYIKLYILGDLNSRLLSNAAIRA